MTSRAICLLLILRALVATPALAFTPNVEPALEIRRAAGEIRIDGELGDAGWAGVAVARNWSETSPGDNAEPAIGHQAWITYDDEALYFAIIITEDPESVRASLRDRDQIWRDDYAGLIFDPYGTGAWAYELFVNPHGVQGDLRWTPNGEDGGFDLVWESEGRITDTGWQVEVRVPFRSLRFPESAVQEWRATFWHNRPRESRLQYSWSANDRDNPCWPCTWGTLRGMRGITAGGSAAILPSLTAFDARGLADTGDPASNFGPIDSAVEIGGTARYAFNSSLSAEIAINPDFSQVESDEAQIDANTTFALFFPEHRPFFQEGSDLYASFINAIYTRSINAPDWATKITGRTDRSSTALLISQDDLSPLVIPFEERTTFLQGGRSWSAVGRSRYSLGGESYLGALGTARALDGGGGNLVLGGDTMVRFLGNYQLESQWLASYTREPELPEYDSQLAGSFADGRYSEALDGEDFWGTAGYTSAEYHGRDLFVDLDYWLTTSTFRADNGFVVQNSKQRLSLITVRNWRPDNRVLDSASAFLMIARVWNTDGLRKDEWIRPELDFQFKSQTSLGLGGLVSNERFAGENLAGIRRFDLNADTRFSEILSGGVAFEAGRFVARHATPSTLGNGRVFNAFLNLQPTTRLSIEPSFQWQRLEHPDTGSTSTPGFFDGSVTRARIGFQFTREFFLRLVLQYNDFSRNFDVEPLLTYRINPFTVFYAGSAHRWQDYSDSFAGYGLEETNRQYFAKFQYLFHN